MHLGIVGAGAGAAALAYVVENTADVETTILEKSGGVCGRADLQDRLGRVGCERCHRDRICFEHCNSS